MASIAEAERAQKRMRKQYGRLEGVRGVGLTWDENGDAHIRVNVDSNFREKICGLIPSDFDGVAVELRSVRDLKTFTSE